MRDFGWFWERAVAHHGDAATVEAALPQAKSGAALRRRGDDRYLSDMALGIFQAGFVWKVVEHKWPGFEAAFEGFEPAVIALWPQEKIEALASDTRVIRNLTKLRAVHHNAALVVELAREHGSFGRFLAAWPDDDPVALWAELARRGSRLGGMTGPVFLRRVGKDTFLLSRDVCRALEQAGVFEGNPHNRKNLALIQQAFLRWQAESKRPLCAISRVLALSMGPAG